MTDLELQDGLWLSMSGIAKQQGVTRQAISKRVPSLEAAGLLKTRRGPKGTKEINLAQYVVAVRTVGDPARELAAETRRENTMIEADYADRVVNLADFVVAITEEGVKWFTPVEYALAREIHALRTQLLQKSAPIS